MRAKLVMFLVVVALVGQGIQKTVQADNSSTLSHEETQRILQATLRIEMAIGEVGVNRIDGNALGSLVMLEGETVVVTHNHWATLLDAPSTISLRAADRTLISTQNGTEFNAAIIYQDAGTIIFQAPVDVLSYVQEAHIEVPKAAVGQDLEPGTVVWSVYFPNKVDKMLGVRAMMVEPQNEDQQPAVYHLRSLNDLPNKLGDSGGGIWFNGKLVGNLWAIMMEAAPGGGWQDSSASIAAVLTR